MLTDLLKGPLPDRVDSTDECEAAFKDIKTALASKPVLNPPNYDILFTLYTDALDREIGAVLTQKTDDGEHPIHYSSRKLFP